MTKRTNDSGDDFGKVARVRVRPKPESKRKGYAEFEAGRADRQERTQDAVKRLQREDYARRKQRGLEDARRAAAEGSLNVGLTGNTGIALPKPASDPAKTRRRRNRGKGSLG